MSDIDPQEFGQLQAEVLAQRRELERLAEANEKMASSLGAIQRQLSEARGGWHTLVLLGGAAATLGAGVTWLMRHVTFHP